jgi:hypothetical protein
MLLLLLDEEVLKEVSIVTCTHTLAKMYSFSNFRKGMFWHKGKSLRIPSQTVAANIAQDFRSMSVTFEAQSNILRI